MKIGKIILIEYDKFRVKLFHTTKNSAVTIDGRVYYFGNIGSYLKVMNSLGEYVLCEVVSVVDKTEDESKVYSEFNLDSSREIIMKPIGTLLNTDDFNMGIGVFPSLYSDAEIVTFDDFDKILKPEFKSKDKVHSGINIGTSKSLISYNIELDINRLFNIHTAILGNTGSGKSTTIAHILQEVYRKNNYSALGAKTIIFDANGEYPKAFSGDAHFGKGVDTIFYKPNIKDCSDASKKVNEGNVGDKETSNIKYTPFYLPYYLMNLDEWLAFLMASERTQKPFWDRVLQECYKFYMILGSEKTGDMENSVNYIKWKLYQMLNNIITRVDGDTAKMTAAKGVIAKIKSIYSTIKGKGVLKDKEQKDVISDLNEFLTICDDLCVVYYGSNNDSLSKALGLFVATDNVRQFVCITPQSERGVIKSYDTKITDARNGKCFRQIDEPFAIGTNLKRLTPGEYFDCDFLNIAVELVLLEEEAKGNLRIREYVSTLMSRLDYFLYNPECEFMRKIPHKEDETEGQKGYTGYVDYLEKTLGVSNMSNRNQLITIDSSEVGAETLELMTSVLSRMIFDYKKTKQGDDRQRCPMHLILDEAHRYIHKDADYFMQENIFEKIAREGRKYSLYLMISSQRPSELSQTVLSQCGNYIVHRIQNETDMKYIISVLPYFSADYGTKIKQAVPGEALIFGNCVPMPLMVNVTPAEPAPNSDNCDIRKEWFVSSPTKDNEAHSC